MKELDQRLHNKLKERFEGFIDKNDTIKDGIYRIYHKNDSLWQVGAFKKNQLVGPWLDYYPNGKLKQKLIFKDGLLSDTSYSYYESGGVYQINHYHNDSLVGRGVTYYENGNIMHENSIWNKKFDSYRRQPK